MVKETYSVFMGGTSTGFDWRNPLIKDVGDFQLDFFNPVVDNWDESARKAEIYKREHSDLVLYCITPDIMGVYSIAEVIDSCHSREKGKTLFYIYYETPNGKQFSKESSKSLSAVGDMVERLGGVWFKTYTEMVGFFKGYSKSIERKCLQGVIAPTK